MTQEQIRIIQDTWSQTLSLEEDAGILFYNELFRLAPKLRHLFTTDMREQSGKFTSMLTFVAFKLDRLEEVLLDAADLGKRHPAYRVPEESYGQVYQALINTLQKVLGPDFTPQTEAAWHEIYRQLSEAMKGVQV